MIKLIFIFIKKEFILDFKQLSGIISIVVYLLSILFFISNIFKNNYTPISYAAVYLIIFLFTSLISSHRNFSKESIDEGMFNYIYYSPIQYIIGKIIYNVFLNLLFAVLLLCFYVLLNGWFIANFTLFFINIIGLCVGWSALLSLTASISIKTHNNFALMSILSFPLILPLIIISSKLTLASIQDIPISMNIKYIVSLWSIDMIILVLSIILFPQIWKE